MASAPLSALLLAALLPALGCGGSAEASGGPSGASREDQGLPVAVARAERRDVPVQLRAVGRAESIASVVLKPQVEGRIAAVKFSEGDEVAAGDVLVQIDDRPFQALVKAAEANVKSDQAMAENARLTLEQMKRVEDLMAERDVQTAQADADAAQAKVLADQAALELARLRVEYCSIRAPIAGRTGLLSVRVGSVVKSVETELLTINQMAPIRVAFSVPEQQLSEIRARQAESPLAVEVRLGQAPPVTGRLSFIDNAVDTTTGTVRLMASFDNADRALWPGQFVEVLLTVSLAPNVVVVPSIAVQAGQAGPFVYVVRDDQTVEQRNVVVQRNNGQDAVIEQGLEGGESVVTEGQLRLGPGARVKVGG